MLLIFIFFGRSMEVSDRTSISKYKVQMCFFCHFSLKHITLIYTEILKNKWVSIDPHIYLLTVSAPGCVWQEVW